LPQHVSFYEEPQFMETFFLEYEWSKKILFCKANALDGTLKLWFFKRFGEL